MDQFSKVNDTLVLIAFLLISFGLLVTSALAGVFMGYPLLASLLLLMVILRGRGFSLRSLLLMCFSGARQALPVVNVLLLISVMSAVWMAAGTVPALVYYGTSLISPQFFILWAFVLTSAVSTLMGTSFGTVATLGVSLMVMARSGGVATSPVAGAIIAGAFVGDRCSPMSSSAHLVASVTGTSLYTNLRHMVRNSGWSLMLSMVFYSLLSLMHPLQLNENAIATELSKTFDLSVFVLVPAIALLLLATVRVNVKLAMTVSIGLGIAMAHSLQQYSWLQVVQFVLFGFHLDASSPLAPILSGGGLLPMAKATLVVFISTAFAGIFAGSNLLNFAEGWLQKVETQRQLGRATVLSAVVSNVFGCTQTIAILMTGQLMRSHYQRHYQQIDPMLAPQAADEQLALALEDTAVVIAPLIPWNIAGLIPATVLEVGAGFIPYAVYLFLLPCFWLVRSFPRKPSSVNVLPVVFEKEACLQKDREKTL